MNRPEVRNRMADKTLGRKHTPETRAKIRASCTARFHGRMEDDDVAAATTAAAAAATAAAAGGASGEVAAEPQKAAEAAPAVDRGVAAAADRPRTSVARQPTASDTASLPFSHDNATLGPRVLSALGPAGCTGDGGSGAAWLSADDASRAGGGRGSGTMPKRGPLSAETRAKLSRRIRDMWANDAGYRARVSAGIASRSSSRVRQLSAQHREAIRQSLLSRNAALREQGVAHPSTRYAEGRPAPAAASPPPT
ncbi:hypothetical protein BU14_0185s0017 [Porphyra umbilicalis]|uniref:Nuclease associated modular domain-containing protein n=1 Tax=Porphyra umbilicalis TaxID=2786 RepID=A0A1X6P6V1_PORUM|nr:hypothetical protein BU14_0185s0017 [Porphyra umbilicalis]|eukprot:OSX76557.1 hypothetical protein BU14_0185s0017 [Porphyra umbilicalis]